MQTENDFLHEIAEIILSMFKDPVIGLTKEAVCRDGHFSPKMLTVDKLLHMQCSTMLRLLLYLCAVLSDNEFRALIKRLLPMIRLPGCDIPISLEETAEEDSLAAEETACPQPEALMLQHLDVFNVRCLKYEERLRLFITAVQKYRPALVVLDSVRDLLADINGTNSIGQSMWQLPVKEAEQKPQEPELFDQIAADLGYSPTS